MKKMLLLIFFLAISAMVHAQAPNAIPYQGVARNASGDVLSTQAIALRISLHDSISSGAIVYQELHNATTTALGLFNINIGTGTPSIGTLAAVNWGSGAKFIQVEMDPAGGTSYTDMGTTQLMSVPYALFAGNSIGLPAGTAAGNTMRWNGTAWVADNALFNDGTNVGIGTATPAAKLDVAGNIKITDGTEGAGKVLKSNANGLASWGTLTGTDVLSTPLPPANLSCLVVAGSVATGSRPHYVDVSGNYAYVVNFASGNMQVINISNAAAPTVTGSLSGLGSPVSIAVSGNYAYVTNFVGHLKVINISNPASPSLVSSTNTGISPRSVAISGNYAYVVDQSSHDMKVLNITNPASPTLAGVVTTGSTPVNIAVAGNYAYVANYSGTMEVINISNPATPVVMGAVTTGSGSSSVVVSGNYAYVVSQGSNNLMVIDITTPSTPAVIGTVTTANGPTSVSLSGNYAFVANNVGNTVQVINISNPTAPSIAGSVPVNGGPLCIKTSGNYAYVVSDDPSNTLQVIHLVCSQNFAITVDPATGLTTPVPYQWNNSGNDMSNANTGNVGIGTAAPGAKLEVAGQVKITGGAPGAGKVLKSDAAGLANWSALSGTDLLSTPIPANLLCPAGSVGTGNQPRRVAVSGNYAYVVNGSGNTMYVINITNPAAPAVVGSVGTGNQPYSLALSGNYAFVANVNSNNLQVIDISNPAAPTVVGSVGTGIQPYSVAVAGNYAYVTNSGSNTMQVINISNPAAPTVVGSVVTQVQPRSVALSGNYAYVTNIVSETMQIINIANPAAPVVVSSLTTGGEPASVAVAGNYAYVGNTTGARMVTINIANPAAPVVEGTLTTGVYAQSIAVSGNFVYVVSYSGTVQVINITIPAAPAIAGALSIGGNLTSLALSGNSAYVTNLTSNTMQMIYLVCSQNFAITVDPATGLTTAIPSQWNTSGNDMSNANIGNVGIGTVSPSSKLDITKLRSLNTTTPGLVHYNLHLSAPQSGINDSATGITFGTTNNLNAQAGIYVQNSNAYGTKMFFGTTNSYATGSQTRLTIDNIGNVGIGTTTPSSLAKLEVAGQVKITGGAPALGKVLTSDGAGLATWQTPTGTIASGTVAGNTPYWNGTSWIVNSSNIYNNGGNVGIGTTSPANKLDVEGGLAVGATYSGTNAAPANGAIIEGNVGIGTTAIGTKLDVCRANSDGDGDAISFGSQTYKMGKLGEITSDNGVYLANVYGANAYLDFRVAGNALANTKMRVHGNGNVGIGTTTTPAYKLEVVGSVLFSGGYSHFCTTPDNSSGNISIGTYSAYSNAKLAIFSNQPYAVHIDNPTSPGGYALSVNGTAAKPGGGSWINASDARLKDKVVDYKEGLMQILKIRPVKYHYNKESGFNTEKEYVGVLAQELQQIAPYMVSSAKLINGDKEYLNVDNSAMTYMLINAVKEQQKLIDELTKRLQALESK